MFKSYTVILLSFFLTVSILAPSVLTLLSESPEIVVVDFEEEEFETQEAETEDSEEEMQTRFFYSLASAYGSIVVKKMRSSMLQVNDVTAHILEIQLPPPETCI